MDPLRIPWVAYRQPGIDNDHIHVVAATRTFSGRPIDLRLSAAKTDDVQAELAARLGMHRPRLHKEAHGVSGQIVALRKIGRRPEIRPLIDAINTALASWPASFGEFARSLRRQPGGYTVEPSHNTFGRVSALFRGPDLKPVRGGALAKELEPRFLRSRFVLARARCGACVIASPRTFSPVRHVAHSVQES
ncbi:hypothetical protein [Rhodobacter capsulatus]|uniref:hypothetical protein n=1 Tax=Rhodobacter capsulatus TaxID=1061 RepID=UPI0004CF67D1|nr:hypothetical protein [Rhodobacter capsulatus]